MRRAAFDRRVDVRVAITVLSVVGTLAGVLVGCTPSEPTPPPEPAANDSLPAPAPPPPTAAGPSSVAECPPASPAECEPAFAEVDHAAASSSLHLTRVGYSDLPGWADDSHADAIPALLASCQKLARLKDGARLGASPYGGRARDWRSVCAAAKRVTKGDDAAAKAFFEAELTPYATRGNKGTDGKLTGYYVQPMRGSRTRSDVYRIPISARPPDLVSVPLSRFIPDGRDRRIWGRVDPSTGILERYPTRAELRKKTLRDDQVLLWADDPVDAVFAEIQGSARVEMSDGTIQWIAFAGKNGQRFRGVGGILRRMGELKKGQGSMAGIRKWFEANPDRYHEIVDKNPAKVFFKFEDRAGAIGTQDVILTPLRSAAVDRALVALSTPMWMVGKAPTAAKGPPTPFRRIVIAQDTGGAIRGTMRADLYFGADDKAAAMAGRMGGRGKMWLLLPRGLKLNAD